jgi:hypothetical protein
MHLFGLNLLVGLFVLFFDEDEIDKDFPSYTLRNMVLYVRDWYTALISALSCLMKNNRHTHINCISEPNLYRGVLSGLFLQNVEIGMS